MPTSLWLAPICAVAIAQIAILATSIYLHRALAHRSLRVHPVADVVFRTVLWLTTGQRRREWVAVHRKHHAFTDRDGDPHSPRLLGVWRIQLLNAYYYKRAAADPQTIATFAPDLPEDWLERRVFAWSYTGLLLGITMVCAAIGFWPGLAAAAGHAVLYVFVLAPLINGLGHWRGQQNFENTAYNSRWLALVTGGESLHNNHHASPRSPKLSMCRLEFDPSWAVIRLLATVGLLEVLPRPDRPDPRASTA
jgi:stearoyl-CoA desaturase (delta-9 desaturase)